MKLTELDVWLQAVDLVVHVYRVTAPFPDAEKFGLTIQIRRAAVSVASNIAEGEGRRGRRDHSRFLLNARGSLYELQTQIVICERLGYLLQDDVSAVIEKVENVGRLINGTMRYLAHAADR
jgi:four helix bundle protein